MTTPVTDSTAEDAPGAGQTTHAITAAVDRYADEVYGNRARFPVVDPFRDDKHSVLDQGEFRGTDPIYQDANAPQRTPEGQPVAPDPYDPSPIKTEVESPQTDAGVGTTAAPVDAGALPDGVEPPEQPGRAAEDASPRTAPPPPEEPGK
jgi:hypothetical protein